MSTDPVMSAVRTRRRERYRGALAHGPNWYQLVRFLCVGACGYAVNVGVFALAVHAAGLDYRLAAVVAFVFALTTTFVLNRHWTFGAVDGHTGLQGARYAVVNLVGFAVNLIVLQVLVELVGLAEVPSAALAALFAAPVNFLGQRQWAFR